MGERARVRGRGTVADDAGTWTRAFVGLGSNLGDRKGNLVQALAELARLDGVRLAAVSSLYRTEPVGYNAQEDFYNAVAAADTRLGPGELLGELLRIEATRGRRRTEGRWGPRVIDLDLLLHGETVADGPGLTVPHPEMHRRRFVLEPLAEIAPGARHPVLGLTVRELLAALDDTARVERIGELEASG
jgi:2-amino-4-hydroxy-6-hydroxymethyldihydropteridine diphosphokinase